MNPLLKGARSAIHLKDSGAKVLVAWHGFAEPRQAGSEERARSASSSAPASSSRRWARAERSRRSPTADDDPRDHLHVGHDRDAEGATLTHATSRRDAVTARDWSTPGRRLVDARDAPLFHVFGMNSVMNVSVRARGC
jgi:long-chain acyl-CoA synthetase